MPAAYIACTGSTPLVKPPRRPNMPPTVRDVALIRAMVLPAWQTAAAIAQHAGVPARTAITVLKKNATDWQLETKLVRIDGHNQVHMFRQRRMVQVMGVAVPQGEEETES